MCNLNVPCKYTTYDIIIHTLSDFHWDDYLVPLKEDNSYIHINIVLPKYL